MSVNTAQRMGPLMKTATVYSNDRTAPVQTVSVTMKVVLP